MAAPNGSVVEDSSPLVEEVPKREKRVKVSHFNTCCSLETHPNRNRPRLRFAFFMFYYMHYFHVMGFAAVPIHSIISEITNSYISRILNKVSWHDNRGRGVCPCVSCAILFLATRYVACQDKYYIIYFVWFS